VREAVGRTNCCVPRVYKLAGLRGHDTNYHRRGDVEQAWKGSMDATCLRCCHRTAAVCGSFQQTCLLISSVARWSCACTGRDFCMSTWSSKALREDGTVSRLASQRRRFCCLPISGMLQLIHWDVASTSAHRRAHHLCRARMPTQNPEPQYELVSCCLYVPYDSMVLRAHYEAIGTRPGSQLSVWNRPWVSDIAV